MPGKESLALLPYVAARKNAQKPSCGNGAQTITEWLNQFPGKEVISMAQPPMPHDYYYGNEADQYTFYRLPKVLFTDSRYKTLSDGAKILYGLMLDRMGLSMKNGWLDEQNRVFIYFTLEDVTEQMNCKNDKGVKLLAELDSAACLSASIR